MRPAATLLLILFLAPLTLAQQALVVGQNGEGSYTDIQAAIDAAQDGDFVLVHPGTYPGFIMNKGILLRAASTPLEITGTVLIDQVTAARAGVSGLVLLDKPLVVQDSSAPILLENIEIRTEEAGYTSMITVDNCDNVAASQILFTGTYYFADGGAGIAIDASSMRISDASIIGQSGFFDFDGDGGGTGGYGIHVQNSNLELANSTVRGGKGGDTGCVDYSCGSFGPCCGYPGGGGVGMKIEGSSVLIMGQPQDSILYGLGGEGNGGLICSCGPDGPVGGAMEIDAASEVTISLATTTGAVQGTLNRLDLYPTLTMTEDLVPELPVDMQIQAVEPGSVILIFSNTPGSLPMGGYFGPNLSALPGDFFYIAAQGWTDGAGAKTIFWNVSYDPSWFGFPLISQVAVFGQSGLRYLSNSVVRVIGDPAFQDCNGNGVRDDQDIATGTSSDCDGNGIPDECDPDCNGNGIADACDITSGTSADCNANGIPDECIALEADCNSNGNPDDCDISQGLIPDCNANGIPDDCDIASGTTPDCNGNGIPDSCDIASGASQDCNSNGIPDECLAGEADCNNNGLPDTCDIASGTSQDANGDGIPDECSVTRLVPSEYPTIQAAIDASTTGDVVLIADGIFSGNGNRNLAFWGKDIRVASENGPANCIIDASGGTYRGFAFSNGETANAILEGITITNATNGGIYIYQASPTIRNCVVTGCSNNRGAGMELWYSDSLITNCVLSNNTADDYGGGILAVTGSPSIRNCMITGNMARYSGTGLHLDGIPGGEIVNCTIANNEMEFPGGVYSAWGVFTNDGGPRVENCILWGNTEPGDEQLYNAYNPQDPEISYCNIQGSFPPRFIDGGGNIFTDPAFVNPLLGDYHLLPGSPCIDAGNPTFVPILGETDIDGEARVQNGRVDIGADEN